MAVAAPILSTLRTDADVAVVTRSRPAPQLASPRSHDRPPRGRPAIETPQLSVVVVNFCQWQNTARLTQQLRKSEAIRRGAAEIVIVDNHSPDHPLARRLNQLSGVTVVRNARNHGFAQAVNRGGRRSRGDWVLLLNPDVTVPEGFLDRVLEAAQKWPAVDPRAGVIGFQLRNRDGSRQASVGPFPTLLRTIAGLCIPRSRRKCQHRPLTERQTVPWVTGGCLLVRRDCYEEIGGMDEQFFLYYEDVDFCRRAREAGWSVWYDPALRVTHHFPLHVRAVPPSLRLVTRHALLTYSHKHWPRWQSRLLSGIVWAEAVARQALARWKGEAEGRVCYGELRSLVSDVRRERRTATERRIQTAAAYLDRISTAQDGRTTDGEASSESSPVRAAA